MNENDQMPPRVRAALVFVAVLLSPVALVIFVVLVSGFIKVEPLLHAAVGIALLWKVVLFPHDVILSWSSKRLFPGVVAPAVAVAQWGITMVLVTLVTRRWSMAIQAFVSFVAIVAVGITFYWVLGFCGFEFHFDSI